MLGIWGLTLGLLPGRKAVPLVLEAAELLCKNNGIASWGVETFLHLHWILHCPVIWLHLCLACLPILSKLPQPAAQVLWLAVLGNHDYGDGAKVGSPAAECPPPTPQSACFPSPLHQVRV